eukprot:2206031-Pyramimonas_sp.AAC.1
MVRGDVDARVLEDDEGAPLFWARHLQPLSRHADQRRRRRFPNEAGCDRRRALEGIHRASD